MAQRYTGGVYMGNKQAPRQDMMGKGLRDSRTCFLKYPVVTILEATALVWMRHLG